MFVSGNRLTEFFEVDRLSELQNLMEISLMNNPMCRKPNYRNAILKKIPILMCLDGKDVTSEDR